MITVPRRVPVLAIGDEVRAARVARRARLAAPVAALGVLLLLIGLISAGEWLAPFRPAELAGALAIAAVGFLLARAGLRALPGGLAEWGLTGEPLTLIDTDALHAAHVRTQEVQS